ncbi:GTP cyclohydrolase I [Streptomonospora sp. S1-112]|uniref:GTP cyclohydrolase 1 n=1 Tax=Streptomonospora mangrovi TaxID=2883123 RepID=A0A9X3NLT3_9ACTN|nr:GTP cyclohydrolase I [Streptomonospora mangrovi]MDA0564174.1 GTP cyclohydrolase I [Streptomonospora mangrovi]
MTLDRLSDVSALIDAEDTEAQEHARRMMAALGLPVTESGMADTPRRLVRALREFTAGMHEDPARHLRVTFPPEAEEPGIIAVTAVPFVSVCEHHLLPFTGRANVAYVPALKAPIVGLSKLARLVRGYAARPQVQERLGEQVVEALCTRLDSVGAACRISAEHSCMTLRGARAEGAQMATLHLRGVFQTDPVMRDAFLGLDR